MLKRDVISPKGSNSNTIPQPSGSNFFRFAGGWLLLAVMLGGAMSVSVQAQETLITNSAAWRWRKGTNEVSTPVTAWRTNGFNDSTWLTGNAPFHFGTNSSGGDDNLFSGTILGDMKNGYRGIFLRGNFVITNMTEVSSVQLTANYDDGFIAWINGVEVARANVTGPPTFQTNAITSLEPSATNTFIVAIVSQSYLSLGTNVLAVQAFNQAIGGSDFRFDTALQITKAIPPVITSLSPTPGATVSALTQITVVFNKPVTGVTPGALQINGADADAVSDNSGTNFVFTFVQPPVGPVLFYFDIDQSITDLTGTYFDSVSFGSWQVTLLDNVPPSILTTLPSPGASLNQLSQVQVTFTEPVAHVDAGDLLINGVAATNLTGSGAGPYLFQFPPPPAGSNYISWASGHGITDLAATPNAFAGGNWSYSVDTNAASGNVVINELLASAVSTNSLADEDGQFSDWIELYNCGTNAVNLNGWSLTDDAGNPAQWTFPSVTLGAGQYLVVFASGKDRKTPAGGNKMHTSFELKTPGNYLGLCSADFPPRVVSEFAPAFPEQRNDISYGYDSTNALKYFYTPTPGGPNGSSAISGLVSPVHFTVNSGFFDAPFNLILTTPTPGATIRYTTNFSEPTLANGTDCSGPLLVSNVTTIVRAAAFLTNVLPSLVETRRYFYIEDIVRQPASPSGYPTGNVWTATRAYYPMDPFVVTNASYSNVVRSCLTEIPTISIVSEMDGMFGPTNGIYTHTAASATLYRGPGWERPCSAEFILPDGSTGFRIDCGVQIQGGSSRDPNKNGKHSFRLNFKSAYSFAKLNYPMFDDSPVQKFNTVVLDLGINYWWHYNCCSSPTDQRQRAQCVRDQFVSDLQNATGNPSFHGRFAHVYLNNLYWGICYIHERTDEDFVASYFGGDTSDYDVAKNTTFGYEQLTGDKTAYNTMIGLANSGLAGNAQYETLQQYCDVDNLIDYMIVNLWAGNDDWPQHNWYVARKRQPGAGFKFMTWDAEHTLKSVTVNRTGVSDAGPAQVYNALRNNAEFRLRFADHLQTHFFNNGILYTDPNPANAIWDPAHPERNLPAAFYMKRISEITNAIVAESARWGGYELTTNYTRNDGWLSELQALLGVSNNTSYAYTWNYFPQRSANVLQQFKTIGLYPSVAAPGFSQFGGRVAAGYPLVMTNNNGSGTIYYTTNGVDPRVYGSGAVTPGARAYTNGLPVVLNISTEVKARLLGTNGIWSALVDANFTVSGLGVPLRITELMYNPIGGDAYEFLEMQNIGAVPLDLGGFSFFGINFIFPAATMIGAGDRLVLGSNANTNQWKTRYPGVPVAGWYGGKLSNSGERIALLDAAGNTVISVDYSNTNGWPAAADGKGYSLEISDPNGDPDDPANWHASSAQNGTPGSANSTPAAATVVLNEIMALNLAAVTNGLGAFPDWVELQNIGSNSVNLAGWSLSNDGNPRKFVFPATNIAAGGYLVIWCDASNAAPGLHAGFALAHTGENIFLYDASTNRVDAISFGLQVADLTIGRIGNGWQLTQPTPNATNAPVALAASTNVAINEWMASSAPGTEDWLELFNRSSNAPVALRGLYLGTSNALFQIRALSFLPPRGYWQLFADENVGASHLDFKLPAAGGVIALSDATGLQLEQISYGQQTDGISQGRLPDGTASIVTFTTSVSPGAANYLLAYSGPLLNEVLARNEQATVSPWGNYADWVELYNPTNSVVNLAGLALGRSSATSGRWTFPSGVTIPANGYLRVWCDGSRAASTISGAAMNTGFSLPSDSGDVYLFNSLGQPVDSVGYGFQLQDVSIGRTGGEWKLLSNPTPAAANSAPATLGDVAGVRVNEWMASPLSGDDWFELYNTNALPVDLSGLYLTDNPSSVGTTNFQIAPLSFIDGRKWVKWEASGDASLGRNHVNFSLDKQGETIRIYGTNLALIDAVDFGIQDDDVSQGRLPDGATNIVNFPTTPTPGAANYLPLTSVVINEVLTHTDVPLEDAIELFNPTANDVNIGGWYLSDSQSDLKRYRIADGTIIPGGGFKVFYQNQFGTNDGEVDVPPLFSFNSAHGDSAFLSQVDTGRNLTGYRAGVSFDAAANGVSFGRYQTSVGVDFVAMSQRTFGADNPATLAEFRAGTGATNACPLVGPVVINEVMYHPPDYGTNLPDDEEFVELLNVSGATASLFDPAHSANVWRLASAVSFDFATNQTLAAGARLIVVDFNPTNGALLNSFRARYGTNGTIVGPFAGHLNNAGEALELWRPDAPQIPPHPDVGFVPQILVERVAYSPLAPWPVAADGSGASLQRIVALNYGNDPVNWCASLPTAGSANTVPPIGAAALMGNGQIQLTFTVQPSLNYQLEYKNNLTDASWLLLGSPVNASGGTIILSDTMSGQGQRFYRLAILP